MSVRLSCISEKDVNPFQQDVRQLITICGQRWKWEEFSGRVGDLMLPGDDSSAFLSIGLCSNKAWICAAWATHASGYIPAFENHQPQ